MRGAPQRGFRGSSFESTPALVWARSVVRVFHVESSSSKQAKAVAVPAHNGRGLHDEDPGLPILPDRTQPCPQEPICRRQLRPLHRTLQDSNWRASRLRNDGASETMSAVNKCPSGNRRMSDKLQFINLIGIYGRHRWPLFQTWSVFVSCNFSIELLFAPM